MRVREDQQEGDSVGVMYSCFNLKFIMRVLYSYNIVNSFLSQVKLLSLFTRTPPSFNYYLNILRYFVSLVEKVYNFSRFFKCHLNSYWLVSSDLNEIKNSKEDCMCLQYKGSCHGYNFFKLCFAEESVFPLDHNSYG